MLKLDLSLETNRLTGNRPEGTCVPSIKLNPRILEDARIDPEIRAAFLDDYCIVSRDLCLSGGYLDGLESLLARIDLCTDLAQASKILGLVTLGNRLKRPKLLHGARLLYTELSSSFRDNISNPVMSRTAQSLGTAVLIALDLVGCFRN